MDEKLKRLLKWADGGMAAPYTLEIWPTFRCNLNCVFCAHNLQRKASSIDYSKEITPKRWLEILSEACQLGVKEIRLVGGGEPLDADNLSLFMARIKDYKMVGSMTTNGTLFSDSLVKDLVLSGWDRIEFSIDGPNAEINDYLRGTEGVFDKIISTLKLFAGYKNKFKRDKPELSFSTVVTNLNFDKIDLMLNLAHSNSCKQIVLLDLNLDTPISKKLKLNNSQRRRFQENLSSLKTKSKQLNIDLCTDMVNYQDHMINTKKEGFILPNISPKFKFLELPCFEPWYYMQIKHDGRVSPCCCGFCNKREKERMNTESLESMWYGRHLSTIRKNLLNKKLVSDCSFCNALNLHRSNQLRNDLIEVYLKTNPQEQYVLNKIKAHANKMFKLTDKK